MSGSSLALPPLREELKLHAQGREDDGSPSWLIQDPPANRFYRLGWVEFEILKRWSLGDPERIAAQVSAATTLAVEPVQVEQVLHFLAQHNLLQARGEKAIARMLEQARAGRKTSLGWLLKNYLFLRIPLVHPDRFLERTVGSIGWLWHPATLWVLGLSLGLGLYLVMRQWEDFVSTLPYLFSLEGVLLVAAALVVSKVLHELGHAYSLKRFGCQVPSMGVAFLVLWPVLYTDATDAWRVRSRSHRLVIAGAGMAVELALAVIATLLWSFMDDGPLRSAVFLLATTTWVLTLIVNLNPFMRFDGYYLLSDWWGVPNLQERAFALGRWQLREWLFGLGEPAPEYVPARRRRRLVLFAYATWLYRFFLFLGIALLVYHLFFKALGIFLMVVELLWFIGRPVYNEVRQWWQLRARWRLNAASLRTLFLLALALGLAVYPWRADVGAPAIWSGTALTRVYTPLDGRIAHIAVAPGSDVRVGDTLFELASPDLQAEILKGQQRIASLEWQLEFSAVSTVLTERRRILAEELAAEQAAQAARLQEQQRLLIRAEQAGRVADMLHPLQAGEWYAEGQWLATLVEPGRGKLQVFVAEGDLGAVAAATEGRFYPDDPTRPPFEVRLVQRDAFSMRVLNEPQLGSVHGGPIAVREGADGVLIPEQPIYRLLFEPVDSRLSPGQTIVGVVRISGERRVWLAEILKRAAAVLVRESDF